MLCTAAVFLFFPGLIRVLFYENISGGTKNYKDIMLASRIFSGDFSNYAIEKSALINPYYIFLNFLLRFLNPLFLMNFLSPIFGFLFIIVLHALLKRVGVEKESLFAAMLMLILSAPFIYNFTIINENSFVLFFLALGMLLFLAENKISSVLGLLILIIISFGNLIASIVSYSLLILFLIHRSSIFAYRTEKRKRIIFTISSIFLILMLLNIYLTKWNIINENKGILTYFSEITMSNGFNTIILILALIGFLTIGNERKLLKNVFWIALLLFIVFGSNFIVYANIVFCISAAYGFVWVTERKWELKKLKYWSILLIVCGIFFIAMSIDLKIANQRPDSSDIDALNALKELKEGFVLSHQNYGFWIEYFSNKKSFINNLNINLIKDEASLLFYSYNLSLSYNLIKEYNIRYVFITPEMKTGLVWNKDDEGLLFLMKNSNRFKNLYKKNNYEIWEVLDEQG
ncbi:MAG: hypothetical protein ACP5H9_02495 [Candidatus Woesearchaeota archaeon]